MPWGRDKSPCLSGAVVSFNVIAHVLLKLRLGLEYDELSVVISCSLYATTMSVTDREIENTRRRQR